MNIISGSGKEGVEGDPVNEGCKMTEQESVSDKKSQIVIVEDEKYVLDFLTFALKEHGCEVISACDGQEALTVIDQHRPHLVVLDLMLPKIDGFTVLKKLSENPETAKIPVLVLSAYTASESTRRMLMANKNVCDVFSKPVRSQDFISKVKEIVGRN